MSETKLTVGERRFGKSHAMGLAIEAALDAGRTVAVVSGGKTEVRGAGIAKDITPAGREALSHKGRG